MLNNPSCIPHNDGSITLTTANVNSYSWAPSGGTTSAASGLGSGTYTVTISNSTCSTTQQFMLTNTVTISPSIQLVSNVSCFNGTNGSAIVTATGGTASYTYSWSPAFSTLATAVNLPAGINTATVTDGNGCIGTSSITLTQPNQLTFTYTGGIATCIGATDGSITLNPTGGTGTKTYWKIVSGTPISQTTAVFTGLSEGITYEFYVTDANNCISGHQFITIGHTTNDCCFYSNQLPTSGILTLNYNLNSSITLTADLTLNGCQVICKEGKSITIPSGKTLTIDLSARLYACGNMWSGIILQPGGIVMIHGNSSIEDAEYGIYAKTTTTFQSRIRAVSANFKRCFIGIYVEPLSLGNYNNIIFTVYGSNFNCSTSLHPSINISPLGDKTYEGIELNNMNCTIGKVGSATNVFDNIHYGIYSNESILTVRNSIFKNIHEDPAYGSFFGGVGVYATGYESFGLLKVYGDAPDDFYRCDQGIHSDWIPVEIHLNTFNEVGTGIFLYGLPLKSRSLIYANVINCSDYGVFSYYQDDIDYIDINANTINVNNSLAGSGVGIGLYDYGSEKNIIVENNTINLNSATAGIQMWGASMNGIYKNTINVGNNILDEFYGISVAASDKNAISCNQVLGTNAATSSVLQYGYYVSESLENDITCNSAQAISYGFEFNGNCQMPEKYTGNYMSDNWVGLDFNFSGAIDKQTHRGNAWNPGTFASGHEAENIINFTSSRFYKNPADPTVYNPSNPLPPNGWFNDDPNGSYYDCVEHNVCPDIGGGGGAERGNLELMIANDSYSPPEFTEESKWMAKNYLYSKINDNPEMLNESLFSDFHSIYSDSSVGNFTEVIDSIKTLSSISASDSLLLTHADSLIKEYSTSLELYDSLYDAEIIDSLTWLFNKNSISTLISLISVNASSTLHAIKIAKEERVDEIISQNSSISFSKEIEENERQINEIYLNTIAKNIRIFTDNQKSQLLSIAHQCPFSGGRAVYRARSICLLFSHSEIYNDNALCNSLGLYRKANPLLNKNSFSYAFPNPTDKSVTISYSFQTDAKTELRIYSSDLKLINSEPINPDSKRIIFIVENLMQGLYIYNFVQNDQVVSFGKFAIIH